MEKVSAIVTTFNNADTLEACLESVKWADEIVLLDSYSTDDTLQIAERFGCRIFQQTFLGYGPQKQSALEKTIHRWVLLLDADEALSAPLQREIRDLLRGTPDCDGYEIPRQEQMFWRMASTFSRLNHFLRLFDKTKGAVSDMPVHAAPKVAGRVGRLRNPFFHFGETDIHTKVEKVNGYSTGLVADKVARGRSANPWVMVVYPPLYFLRLYLFKRNFLNGWAGFISSVVGSFYAFLKYAKLYEHHRKKEGGFPSMDRIRRASPGPPADPAPPLNTGPSMPA
jgi:glycosyltransferase involved in cell wall biosynthesis